MEGVVDTSLHERVEILREANMSTFSTLGTTPQLIYIYSACRRDYALMVHFGCKICDQI